MNLSGPAAKFVSGVVKARSEGKEVVSSRAVDILAANWGVKIASSTFRAHMRGDCSCKK